MRSLLLSLIALGSSSLLAQAHMVYLVPTKEGMSVTVLFSDSLEVDEKVKMDKLGGMKLLARVGGKDTPVDYTKADHSFALKVSKNASLVYATAVYGLLPKSEKSTLLVYHPKLALVSVVGNATALGETIGEMAELEITPIWEASKVRFRLLAKGKPVSSAAGSVVLPDGTKKQVRTDMEGNTPAFDDKGRFGIYLHLIENKSGEHSGKKFEEIRHYATLVVDVVR